MKKIALNHNMFLTYFLIILFQFYFIQIDVAFSEELKIKNNTRKDLIVSVTFYGKDFNNKITMLAGGGGQCASRRLTKDCIGKYPECSTECYYMKPGAEHYIQVIYKDGKKTHFVQSDPFIINKGEKKEIVLDRKYLKSMKKILEKDFIHYHP